MTSSQLEEFYDDYYSCPVAAFNTQTIDFAKVPLAKYRMQEGRRAGTLHRWLILAYGLFRVMYEDYGLWLMAWLIAVGH